SSIVYCIFIRALKAADHILWRMFYRENVDNPTLFWEDIADQIDHRKEKRSRCENMPYPRFTKIIINHFLKQHKSLTNLDHKHYHAIKDDRIVSRLKFVSIGEDYQEYELPILDVMLTNAIKHSESYQMFINYSTHQIPPKKSRGKELEPVKKKIGNRRVVKKKVTLSDDENIISNDHDAALELAKSINKTKAEEVEASKKVHDTHARIVTESAKKKSGDRSTRGSSKRTGSIPGIPKESTVISTTSSAGTGIKLGVLDEEKDITEEKVILEWGDKDDENDDVEKDDKDDNANDEGDDHVNEDEEIKESEVIESEKGEAEITNATKTVAEKKEIEKDDPKKPELPPTSSSLSISSEADVSSLLDIPIQQETPHIQSPPVLKVPIALIDVQPRVAKLEQDVSELKIVDNFSKALAVLESHVSAVVDSYLDSKVGDVFQKELQKL
nr:hypothetical protein [Tanacetum cinerariifolium]